MKIFRNVFFYFYVLIFCQAGGAFAQTLHLQRYYFLLRGEVEAVNGEIFEPGDVFDARADLGDNPYTKFGIKVVYKMRPGQSFSLPPVERRKGDRFEDTLWLLAENGILRTIRKGDYDFQNCVGPGKSCSTGEILISRESFLGAGRPRNVRGGFSQSEITIKGQGTRAEDLPFPLLDAETQEPNVIRPQPIQMDLTLGPLPRSLPPIITVRFEVYAHVIKRDGMINLNIFVGRSTYDPVIDRLIGSVAPIRDKRGVVLQMEEPPSFQGLDLCDQFITDAQMLLLPALKSGILIPPMPLSELLNW